MDDTPDTHRAYPYAFCLSLAYELKDGILFMEYQVENRDQRDMWYAIGAHPGFNCPMEEALPLRITSWYLKRKKTPSASLTIWSSCTFLPPNREPG